ncbi:MAG: NAD(P)H-hydrate dehydratase [Gammaproteobacteria bacterium]|nr:NAD(P)H-hydrate dehydratase [Gammaproteobacteria bacterium]
MERSTLPQELYTQEQVARIDREIVQQGIPAVVLMERAGYFAFKTLTSTWPEVKTITVLCGSGNNGGDGYVLARLAHQAGFTVMVYQVGNPKSLKPEARTHLEALMANGVKLLSYQGQTFSHPTVIVDALLGVGLQGAVRADYQKAIQAMNDSEEPILAIDIPSGIHASTGASMGKAVRASATTTFIVLKQGLFTAEGPQYAGILKWNDLQVPSSFFASIPPACFRLVDAAFKGTLPKRSRSAHKGFFGHVLIVGGNFGMQGAALLAGEAALSVGAGRVSVATRRETAHLLYLACPELMCHTAETARELSSILKRVSIVAVGPGLGQDRWAKNMLRTLLKSPLPLIIDADALNCLAQEKRFSHRAEHVITPHPGEAAKLLHKTAEMVQNDRFSAIYALQRQYGGCVVLKGNGTLILDENKTLSLCDRGNPGMASAGMGDVLTGVIAGLHAQGVPLPKASQLGVYLHAKAGDKAAQNGELGITAGSLMHHLTSLVNAL